MNQPDRPIRIMLADDQSLIRQGIRYILDLQPDMQVVTEASTGDEAVALTSEYQPDLILMDIQMPGMTGIEATRAILQHQPEIKIVLLTTFDVQEYVIDGIRAGASGYLLKDIDMNEMIQGIRSVCAGGAIYNTTTAGSALVELLGRPLSVQNGDDSSVASIPLAEPLTERELEVLQAVAYGKRNFEIAADLYVSESTVKTHVHNIIQKLGVKDRTQAAVVAIRQGIVS
ncbi:response regulator [Paenibacillus bovis]|uniref:DNA-binding response regulator n=1 Tax=Paenibacillus bovis TaxID=1616788 RepID=A0A172ZGZ5_9BACL|nr:response regulator transcription factor [Paenibacillus bovis]ANF96858.1 DNA-binding response regulator [Paenibacillus bovis]